MKFEHLINLRIIDELKIKAGETVAIIGKNQSGKTALLDAIAGNVNFSDV